MLVFRSTLTSILGDTNRWAYRGADKSLARPWKETSYSDQDLQLCTKTYGVKSTRIYSWNIFVLFVPRVTTVYQEIWRTNNRNIFLLFVPRVTTVYQEIWRTNNRNIFLLFVPRVTAQLKPDGTR